MYLEIGIGGDVYKFGLESIGMLKGKNGNME